MTQTSASASEKGELSNPAPAPALARLFAERLVGDARRRIDGHATQELQDWSWGESWADVSSVEPVEQAVGRALIRVHELVSRAGADVAPPNGSLLAPPKPVVTSPGPASAEDGAEQLVETAPVEVYPVRPDKGLSSPPPTMAPPVARVVEAAPVKAAPAVPTVPRAPSSPGAPAGPRAPSVPAAPAAARAPSVPAAPAAARTLSVPLEAKAPESVEPAVPDHAAKRRQQLFTGFTWVRNIGLIVILFAVWQLWGTSIEHAHAQGSLQEQFSTSVARSRHPVAPAGARLIPASTQVPQPAPGAPVAHLQIPAIGVNQYVVQGTAASDLAEGPGHYIGTAMPGQLGNVAIAGHRTTYGAPFNQLDQLAVGDSILLTTPSGEKLVYSVSRAPVVVAPTDVAVLNDFGDNRLTLTTCNPKYSAAQRLVVVAELRSPSTAPLHHPVQRVSVVVGSAGWNLRYLPGALLFLALLVGLGLIHGRISGYLRDTRWLILGPIWLAGIFLLFVELNALLPATL